ncbi:MAG: hypothetical protein LBV45_05735 [Xanthomonadaceae bacterium]|jgi:hypothetical protein|nr:hypothetical protein [Xanthomonadaceae bacterium]
MTTIQPILDAGQTWGSVQYAGNAASTSLPGNTPIESLMSFSYEPILDPDGGNGTLSIQFVDASAEHDY